MSILVYDNGEGHEDANKRLDSKKIEKERKRRGVSSSTYKEELVATIRTKKVFAAEQKEDKAARCNEIRLLEDEKWKLKLVAEESKLKAEERRLALKEARLHNVKKPKTVLSCS